MLWIHTLFPITRSLSNRYLVLLPDKRHLLVEHHLLQVAVVVYWIQIIDTKNRLFLIMAAHWPDIHGHPLDWTAFHVLRHSCLHRGGHRHVLGRDTSIGNHMVFLLLLFFRLLCNEQLCFVELFFQIHYALLTGQQLRLNVCLLRPLWFDQLLLWFQLFLQQLHFCLLVAQLSF